MDTDENLFRLVPVPGNGARVLPLELVPVPGHDAQISARAPKKALFRLMPVLGHRARVTKGEQNLGNPKSRSL